VTDTTEDVRGCCLPFEDATGRYRGQLARLELNSCRAPARSESGPALRRRRRWKRASAPGKPSRARVATSAWSALSRNSSTSCSRTDNRLRRDSTRSIASANSISSTGKSPTARACIAASKHGQGLRSDTAPDHGSTAYVQWSRCTRPHPTIPARRRPTPPHRSVDGRVVHATARRGSAWSAARGG